MPQSPVRELRLALTVVDYDKAVAFYRDVLGLPVIESWDGPDGSGAVLDAGRATLELLSAAQAELVDQVEVGSRVAGPVRVALEVADSVERPGGSSPAAPRLSPSRSSPPGATATSGSALRTVCNSPSSPWSTAPAR